MVTQIIIRSPLRCCVRGSVLSVVVIERWGGGSEVGGEGWVVGDSWIIGVDGLD